MRVLRKRRVKASRFAVGLARVMLTLALAGSLARAQMPANGDFSDGGAGWDLTVSHGAEVRFAAEADTPLGEGRAATVNISEPAFTAWQIALTTPVQLEAGARYRLSFRTAARAPAGLYFCIQADEPPHRILHLGEVQAGPEPRQYGFVVPEVPEAGRMRLAFWFANGETGTYWLDDVTLRELTEEETARLGAAPEGFVNGDFSAGLEGWELRVHHGAAAELSLDAEPRLGDGNCGRVTVTKSTDTGWHVQLMEIFRVKAGRRYRATFSAMAERPVETTVSFQVPPPTTRR
jgi:hypothetical protein